MKNHTKLYMDYFGYVIDDFIPCEVCGRRGQDIHHIRCRGMGGSKDKDDITNLMCLCREDHVKFGDKKQYMDYLTDIHNKHLKNK